VRRSKPASWSSSIRTGMFAHSSRPMTFVREGWVCCAEIVVRIMHDFAGFAGDRLMGRRFLGVLRGAWWVCVCVCCWKCHGEGRRLLGADTLILEAKAALNCAQVSGDGKISEDEFRYALACAGLRLSDAEVSAVVRGYDTNGDGRVDYGELVRMVEGAKWHPSYPYSDTVWESSGRPMPAAPAPSSAEMERAALQQLQRRVRSVYASLQAAWLDLHPHADESGTMGAAELSDRIVSRLGLRAVSPAMLQRARGSRGPFAFYDFCRIIDPGSTDKDLFVLGNPDATSTLARSVSAVAPPAPPPRGRQCDDQFRSRTHARPCAAGGRRSSFADRWSRTRPQSQCAAACSRLSTP
jgi:hypothetical protein